jgi:arylsulfatase A-like enzyme
MTRVVFRLTPLFPASPLSTTQDSWRHALWACAIFATVCSFRTTDCLSAPPARPNIVLIMADDMGWGETGYRGHPVLKTPHLDAMAASGLRFERFYAGAPVCSPTRASVLTGRANDRTGVLSHGYALRLQEKTIAQALRAAGYVTGHFGKWHLNGLRGPGAPILATDERHPGRFGFDEWVSVTNFYDLDPLMSRMGRIEEFQGDSSEIAVSEAVNDLEADPREANDLSASQPDVFARLKQQLLAWNEAVEASFAGRDYPEGAVMPADPEPQNWYDTMTYQPYLPAWQDRWEFKSYLERRDKPKKAAKAKR